MTYTENVVQYQIVILQDILTLDVHVTIKIIKYFFSKPSNMYKIVLGLFMML